VKQQLIEIAGWLQAEGQCLDGVMVSGVSIDSRKIDKGNLFIPFRGEQVNGHKYVESAIKNGAAASLWIFTQEAGNMYFISTVLAILSIGLIFAFRKSSKSLRNIESAAE